MLCGMLINFLCSYYIYIQVAFYKCTQKNGVKEVKEYINYNIETYVKQTNKLNFYLCF